MYFWCKYIFQNLSLNNINAYFIIIVRHITIASIHYYFQVSIYRHLHKKILYIFYLHVRPKLYHPNLRSVAFNALNGDQALNELYNNLVLIKTKFDRRLSFFIAITSNPKWTTIYKHWTDYRIDLSITKTTQVNEHYINSLL